MKILLLVLLLASNCVIANPCLPYSAKVTIRGLLSRHTFAEQPNYESIAAGDAAATYFFVSPHRPLCVSEGSDNDGLEPWESSVSRIQLVFIEHAQRSYDSLRAYLGKHVVCSGTFFHQITGHHHSLVLLEVAECAPAQPSVQADLP